MQQVYRKILMQQWKMQPTSPTANGTALSDTISSINTVYRACLFMRVLYNGGNCFDTLLTYC